MSDHPLEGLLGRLDELLDRAEALLPGAAPAVDWNTCHACRWRPQPRGGGHLEPVAEVHGIRLADLRGIDRQRDLLARNTRQFVVGLPANNALLWGSRGTGKSSLVKALLNEFAPRGLRLVEVEGHDLTALPDIVSLLRGQPQRFVLFSDDLSFEAGDPGYKALKAVLDGSVAAVPDNVLIYATSNRRHLMPEYLRENLEAHQVNGEIHHGEAVEEKVSLSERFGLWLSFYPFDQDTYLEIVSAWLAALGQVEGQAGGQAGGQDPGLDEDTRQEALRWALVRGSRSGRSAWQFARDWVGRRGLGREG